MSLPLQLDYSQSISELPECTNYEVTLTPSTGATLYASGSLVKFDFQQRGFIDPSSIVVRYKYKRYLLYPPLALTYNLSL